MPNGGKDKNKPKLLLSISHHSPRWGKLNTGHRHCHDFCEIMFVKEGEGKVIFDDGPASFKKGDVVIYNPGTMHSESFADEPVATIVFIGISNLSIEGLEPGCLCRGKHAVLPSESHYDALAFYLEQLLSEKDQPALQGIAVYKELLNIIIANILRLSEDATSAVESRKTYTEVKKYIDENYTSIASIDELCKILYINKYYLTHLFSMRYGVSPLQYLIRKRIALSKHLLVNTDRKVDQISIDCGYDDVAYFCRLFKKQEGITPLQFRKLHRSE